MNDTKPVICDELCPNCGREVRVPTDRISLCPECGYPVRPCSMCAKCTGAACPFGAEDYALFAEDVLLAYVRPDASGCWHLIDETPGELVEGLLGPDGSLPREDPRAMALARCAAARLMRTGDVWKVADLLTARDPRRTHPAVSAVCTALVACPACPGPGTAVDGLSVRPVTPGEETWLMLGDDPVCRLWAEDAGWRPDRPAEDVARTLLTMEGAECEFMAWLEDYPETRLGMSLACWIASGGMPPRDELAAMWLGDVLDALPQDPEGAGPFSVRRLGAAI